MTPLTVGLGRAVAFKRMKHFDQFLVSRVIAASRWAPAIGEYQGGIAPAFSRYLRSAMRTCFGMNAPRDFRTGFGLGGT